MVCWCYKRLYLRFLSGGLMTQPPCTKETQLTTVSVISSYAEVTVRIWRRGTKQNASREKCIPELHLTIINIFVPLLRRSCTMTVIRKLIYQWNRLSKCSKFRNLDQSYCESLRLSFNEIFSAMSRNLLETFNSCSNMQSKFTFLRNFRGRDF